MTLPSAVLCCLTAVALAACGSSGGSSDKPAQDAPPAPRAVAQNPKPKPAARPGVQVTTRTSRYGRIVTDGRGRTLYVFTRETGSRSRCYGACATAWPPLTTRGAPTAGKGAHGRLLGTTRRRNGAIQVTYAGRPLYYYVGERRAGEVLCQNVTEYGGTWLVADATGTPVR